MNTNRTRRTASQTARLHPRGNAMNRILLAAAATLTLAAHYAADAQSARSALPAVQSAPLEPQVSPTMRPILEKLRDYLLGLMNASSARKGNWDLATGKGGILEGQDLLNFLSSGDEIALQGAGAARSSAGTEAVKLPRRFSLTPLGGNLFALENPQTGEKVKVSVKVTFKPPSVTVTVEW